MTTATAFHRLNCELPRRHEPCKWTNQA